MAARSVSARAGPRAGSPQGVAKEGDVVIILGHVRQWASALFRPGAALEAVRLPSAAHPVPRADAHGPERGAMHFHRGHVAGEASPAQPSH